VEKGAFFKPDIDESRLHTGEYGRYDAAVDVPDHALAFGAFHEDFYEPPLFQNRYSGFLRGDIDDYFSFQLYS
jgi:hypothetical protein